MTAPLQDLGQGPTQGPQGVWTRSQWIPRTEESGEDGRTTFEMSGTVKQRHGVKISMYGEPHTGLGAGRRPDGLAEKVGCQWLSTLS